MCTNSSPFDILFMVAKSILFSQKHLQSRYKDYQEALHKVRLIVPDFPDGFAVQEIGTEPATETHDVDFEIIDTISFFDYECTEVF